MLQQSHDKAAWILILYGSATMLTLHLSDAMLIWRDL